MLKPSKLFVSFFFFGQKFLINFLIINRRMAEIMGKQEILGRHQEILGKQEILGRHQEIMGKQEILGRHQEIMGRNQEIIGKPEIMGKQEIMGKHEIDCVSVLVLS
jgi:hypothetical protein